MYWKIFIIYSALISATLSIKNTVPQPVISDASVEDFIGEDPFFEVLSPESLKYTYRLKQAQNFGTRFSRTYKGMRLVVADPEDCCSPLYNEDAISGAVALVTRGMCSFVSKTIQAEKAGAIAIIVTDTSMGLDNTYISMLSDETGREPSIPALFLLGSNGEHIRNTLLREHIPEALINIPINMTNVPIKQLNFPPWTVW